MSDEAVLQAIRTKVVRDLAMPSGDPREMEELDDLVMRWDQTTQLKAELDAVQEGLRKALEGLLVKHRARGLIGSTGAVRGRESVQSVTRREWVGEGIPKPVLTGAKVSIVELAIVTSPARVEAFRKLMGTGPSGWAIDHTSPE